MADLNIVALVVAILGAGGIGAAVREIASVISLARKGISGKEDQRRSDIIAQRDAAIARATEAQEREDAADARADREARIRRQWQEEAAKLRRLAIERGEDVGPWPDIESTENPWRNPS